MQSLEPGLNLENLVANANGNIALTYNDAGIYATVGASFQTPGGQTIQRPADQYKPFAAVINSASNYVAVADNAAQRRAAIKDQIAQTTQQLQNATTDAEVQKLHGVLTSLNADLASTDDEVNQAASAAMVQDIQNRNDQQKQIQALTEQQNAEFTEAVSNYTAKFQLLNAAGAVPHTITSTNASTCIMATFDSIFPTFLAKCGELHTLLLSVAFALLSRASSSPCMHGSSHKSCCICCCDSCCSRPCSCFCRPGAITIQNLLQNSILSGLGVDPSKVYQQFNQLLVIKRDPSTQSSWWNVMSQLHNFTTDLIITAMLWLVGQLASLMMFWGYIFQTVILNLGYALSPLLIGFMAIPALKHTGIRYLLNLVGVLLWPLGWAVAALVTQGILDFMTDPSFEYIDPTSTLPDLQKTIGVAAVGFWIIFSTVAAPVIIQHVITQRRSGRQPVAFRRRQQLHPNRRHHGGRRGDCLADRLAAGDRGRGGHGGLVERHFHRRRDGQRRSHHHRRFRAAAALRARPPRRRHHRQQGRPRTHRQIQTQLLLTYGNIRFENNANCNRATVPVRKHALRPHPAAGAARPAAVVLVCVHGCRVAAFGH